jgi:hypothetical protein
MAAMRPSFGDKALYTAGASYLVACRRRRRLRKEEYVMRLATLTVSAAALCASVALGSLSANAEETGSLSGCQKLASQVKDALASNAQAANYEAALKEKNYGRDFCTNELYARGEEHYEQALKLLGESKS